MSDDQNTEMKPREWALQQFKCLLRDTVAVAVLMTAWAKQPGILGVIKPPPLVSPGAALHTSTSQDANLPTQTLPAGNSASKTPLFRTDFES